MQNLSLKPSLLFLCLILLVAGASFGRYGSPLFAQTIVTTGTLVVKKVVVNDNGGSKNASDFLITVENATLPDGSFNFVGTESGTTVLLTGPYNVTEAPDSAYLGTLSAACSGTIAAGEEKECVITNDDKPTLLTVIKTMNNNNGGTAQPGDFTLSLVGVGPISNGVPQNVAPGIYTVAESGPTAGYTPIFSGDCNASGQVTIAFGETKTCTLTNDDKPAKLTVVKQVVTDNGGTAVINDFVLSVDKGVGVVTSGVPKEVNAGTYQVSETGPPGYDASFSGACNPSGQVTLAVGEEKICELTNNDRPASLTVVKQVTNNNGGTALVSNFTLSVSGIGQVTSGVATQAPPGLYNVTETGPSGYVGVFSGACNSSGQVSIALGEAKVCTLTNDDQPATLTVIKQLVPATDSGRFDLLVDNVARLTGIGNGAMISTSLNAGPHTVGERAANINTNLANYVTTISGDCAANGAITLTLGAKKTCTITNVRRGALIIKKVTNPNPDPTGALFGFTTSGGLTPAAFNLKNGQTATFSNLAPGSGYKVTETPLAGWNLSSATCSDGSPVNNITIDPGETITCTFTNSGTLINIALGKSDGGVIAEPSDTVEYTLNYTNTGNQVASSVVITEIVPQHTALATLPGWICNGVIAGSRCTATIGNLAGGARGSIKFRVKVNAVLPAGVTSIINTAILGYAGSPAAIQATDQTPLKTITGLSITKTDGGVTAAPGATISYTLAYANGGNQGAVNVFITETVPANTTFAGPNGFWNCTIGTAAGSVCRHLVGSLPATTGGSVRFDVKVNSQLPAGVSTIANKAQIGDAVAGNVDESLEETPVNAAPDLTLLKSAATSTVQPGDTLIYSLAYANKGNQQVSGVVITETVPANTTFNSGASSPGWICSATLCSYQVGSLAGGGAGGVVKFAVKVNKPLPGGVLQIDNIAGIGGDSANTPDQNPIDNSASLATPLVSNVSVAATKADSVAIDADQDGNASPGDTLEYLVTIRNQSTIAVRNVLFTDEIDDYLKLVPGVTTSRGQVVMGNAEDESRVEVMIGDLAGDDGSNANTVTIRFRVVIEQPLPADVTRVENQGVVRSLDFADLPTDDPGTPARDDSTRTPLRVDTTIQATLIDYLFIDADGDERVSNGDTLVYKLGVVNRGNIAATNLTIRDTPMGDGKLVAGSVQTSKGAIVQGNNPGDTTLEISIDTLAGGGDQVTVSFLVRVDSTNPNGQIQNQATIGLISGASGSQVFVDSDDPDTQQPSDATVTPLGNGTLLQSELFYLPLITHLK